MNIMASMASNSQITATAWLNLHKDVAVLPTPCTAVSVRISKICGMFKKRNYKKSSLSEARPP